MLRWTERNLKGQRSWFVLVSPSAETVVGEASPAKLSWHLSQCEPLAMAAPYEVALGTKMPTLAPFAQPSDGVKNSE
jgi:hypothetical protein